MRPEVQFIDRCQWILVEAPVADKSQAEEVVKCNTHVRVKVSRGVGNFMVTQTADFCVMGFTKTYENKWYLCDVGQEQVWKKKMSAGKFRVIIRMIRYDNGVGRYEYEKSVSSQWENKTIFVYWQMQVVTCWSWRF